MSSFFASALHNAGRRIGDRREPARQFGPRLGLDLVDQAADDVVEQRDVVFVETVAPSRNSVVMRRSASARFSAEPC